MIMVKLGRTGLLVNKDGFGALPLQRANFEDAEIILNKALDAGINYIDTARSYTDSEEKIGRAISHRRDSFIIATKTMAGTAEEFWKDLETSLELLKTSYIDVYQFHNPPEIPKPGDGSGLYEAMEKAKAQGMIRFIGATNHKRHLAREAAESGLYDTLQFPLNYLADDGDMELCALCLEKDVGLIAMKALSGGLITDIGAARNWLAGYENVVPIWGIQKLKELEELIAAMQAPGELSPKQTARIERDRLELCDEFCRGCGYCMPCPVDIPINMAARMSLLLRRAPTQMYTTEYWRKEMAKIEDCIHCDQCAEHCPYELDPPAMLEKNYLDFKNFI